MSRQVLTSAIETETEQELIVRCQQALSAGSWEVGECAALWTQRWSKGRGDATFGELVGLSADQVYQRRRVWETFADVRGEYPALKWSHFYAALNWDDAAECLGWAHELEATVAEMRAWRRAQHGEDLTVEEEPESQECDLAEAVPAAPAVASEEKPYAPFNAERASMVPVVQSPSRDTGPGAAVHAPATSAELVVKRVLHSLNLSRSALKGLDRTEYGELSEQLHGDLSHAVDLLSYTLDDLLNGQAVARD